MKYLKEIKIFLFKNPKQKLNLVLDVDETLINGVSADIKFLQQKYQQ